MLESFAIDQPFFQLLLASVLGGFLGLRREMEAPEKENRSFMGLRTMSLMALFGCLATFFPTLPHLPLFGFGALTIFLAIAYAHGAFCLKRIGMTSEMSAMIIFWVGVLVGSGQPILALLLTLFLALVDGFKQELHSFAHTLKKQEWIGALQLLFFSGAILPFLPQVPIDPWGVFVPFNVWLLVILISGIGFLGYFLTKYFGVRGGITLASFLGALVSSTAVTTSMASQSKKSKLPNIFAVGILIALATMQIRVVVEIIAWGSAEMVKSLILIPLSMALASGVVAFIFYFRVQKNPSIKNNPSLDVKLQSPFEILPALKFGFVFVLILFALAFGKNHLGSSGVYITAFLSGFVDIDAIVLSSLEAVKLGEMESLVARNAIIIGLFTNTLVKVFYVAILGSPKLISKVGIGVLASLGAGTLACLL